MLLPPFWQTRRAIPTAVAVAVTLCLAYLLLAPQELVGDYVPSLPSWAADRLAHVYPDVPASPNSPDTPNSPDSPSPPDSPSSPSYPDAPAPPDAASPPDSPNQQDAPKPPQDDTTTA